MVAMGITPRGTKRVLGFRFGDTESRDKWEGLLSSLKERDARRNPPQVPQGPPTARP